MASLKPCVCVRARAHACERLPGVEEARAEHHDGLARVLLKLQFNGGEFLFDDAEHVLDLALRYRPRFALLLQQVGNVTRELVARLERKCECNRNTVCRQLHAKWYVLLKR